MLLTVNAAQGGSPLRHGRHCGVGAGSITERGGPREPVEQEAGVLSRCAPRVSWWRLAFRPTMRDKAGVTRPFKDRICSRCYTRTMAVVGHRTGFPSNMPSHPCLTGREYS